MSRELKETLELINFVEICEDDYVLEISDGKQEIGPILKINNAHLNYTIDLCVFSNRLVNQEALGYYQEIFFMTLNEMNLQKLNRSYDGVVIPSIFKTLTKEKGKLLINQLLTMGVKTIYLLIDDEAKEHTWTIPDFKDFDFSFFHLPSIEQKLIKIYRTNLSELSPLPSLIASKQPLSILYVLPHQNLTGGLKMLYEQMKALQKRGHVMTTMIRGDYERVIPDWVEGFTPNREIVVPVHQSYQDYIDHVDVIFAGFYSQIVELKNDRVPVLYWEQGHEFLYGDVGNREREQQIRKSLSDQFQQEIYYATDSSYVHDIVKTRFHKDSYVLPIFIDNDFYYPISKTPTQLLTILLVGNPMLPFKGFLKALQVLVNAWNQGLRFKVRWACQIQPTTSPLPFEIEYAINVSQVELAQIYRESDILLSCSIYEGCPMPPLEAMASGVVVLTTNCGGINQYAKHRENALIATSNTVEELTDYLKQLLSDEKLRQTLIENGRQTAQALSYQKGAVLLEEILQSIVNDFKAQQLVLSNQPKRIKVLFMIGTLLGGGAEKVLCQIVKHLNPELFDLTVQTVFDQGIYIEEIKKYAKYKTIFRSTASSVEEAHQLQQNYERLLTLSKEEFSRVVLDEVYDVEIAFLEDQSTSIIAHSPHSRARKIAWVHADLMKEVGSLQFYRDLEEQKECYKKFDEIVFVSKGGLQAFEQRFNYLPKSHVIYNPIDVEEVIELSNQPISSSLLTDKFKVIAVGRFVLEKGFDRLLMAHERLIKEGFDYELLILGDGGMKSMLNEFIEDHQLTSSVKLLGFQYNPYPYIKASDLLVCASKSEGFSLVIAEALILKTPILTTNCVGPVELVANGHYGLVVDNSVDGLYDGLKNLLTNTILYKQYEHRLQNEIPVFSHHQIIKQIEDLLLIKEEGEASCKTI